MSYVAEVIGVLAVIVIGVAAIFAAPYVYDAIFPCVKYETVDCIKEYWPHEFHAAKCKECVERK